MLAEIGSPKMKLYRIHNHITSSLSSLDQEMIKYVPAGGNWQNIPPSIPSKRLEQIRASGGRTTYYGRLRWDKPSYTITTYFNRPGNGCNIHPSDGNDGKIVQHRLISLREAARLQSFPDSFVFHGSRTSIYNQIGNAVPPLLAFSLAKRIQGNKAIDLFCGCGGMSKGFELAGFDVIAGLDNDKHAMSTWANNHFGAPIIGDITKDEIKKQLYNQIDGDIDVIVGGPPCQGFSTAGWRQENDPRNKLWAHYLQVVAEVRPRYFVIENVPGILSAKHGASPVLENMSRAFAEFGYVLSVRKLQAEQYGVPQLRRRVLIVGVRDGTAFTFPDAFCNRPVTVKDAIWNLPPLGVNDGVFEASINYVAPLADYERWLMGEIEVNELEKRLRE